MPKNPIFSEIDLDGNGRQSGYLALTHSVHRSAYGYIPIPIASLKNGPGPTVLLMAGNHGDEYEGQVLISELIRTLDLEDITGQLLLLPMANFPAAAAGLRTSPIDDGNLNRSFPGNPRGTVTEIIAHFIESELIARADFMVDLHSGGSSLLYRPSLLLPWNEGDEINNRKKALIEAFGLPQTLLLRRNSEGWYSSSAALRQDTLSLTTELGGGGFVGQEALRLGRAGLLRVLEEMGLYHGPQPDRDFRETPQIFQSDSYVFANEAGLVELLVEPGDKVTAGQPAARLHQTETPGRDPIELAFEEAGIVLAKRVPARCLRGDCLFHVGTP
ncbi:succinylglutamate desuccinylase/aspartoacylase family protein [Limibacillus sp. MBR-115]|jgi:predicted deacylase|uniref:succinylglutamate desuccinylase/aspartoacylase domain-containing protein n=1 Tax=Limibacillus sp. MBR-115 TaxID=3156465 RepID=UPI003396D691